MEEKKAGKRKMIHHWLLRVSYRPLNSVMKVGFFITIGLLPSSRMTLSASQINRPKIRPTDISAIKAAYVLRDVLADRHGCVVEGEVEDESG